MTYYICEGCERSCPTANALRIRERKESKEGPAFFLCIKIEFWDS